MVRTGHLKLRAFLFSAVVFTTPVIAAEHPRDWYVDLKREAKYARIAAMNGALIETVHPHEIAVSRLIARMDQWDETKTPSGARTACLLAAERIHSGLQKVDARTRYGALVASEGLQDACLDAINRR